MGLGPTEVAGLPGQWRPAFVISSTRDQRAEREPDEKQIENVPMIDRESRQRLVRQVLRNIMDYAMQHTRFQRALAVCFTSPLDVDNAASRVSVLNVAHCGLDRAAQARVQELVDDGVEVSPARYNTDCKLGGSFFYPDGKGLPGLAGVIQSTRHYLDAGGWQQRDILLMPFRVGTSILGHLSLDDPVDGRRPTAESIASLEDMLSVAAVALLEACSLEELDDSQSLYHFLAESGLTGMIVIQDEEVQYLNHHTTALLGYSEAEFTSLSPWWSIFHPDDRPIAWQFGKTSKPSPRIVRAVRRDGRVLWLSASSHTLRRGGSEALCIEFYDLTDRIARESELEKQALRDSLTGLMNRAFFDDAIPKELERSKRYKRPLSLMLGDLRRFKMINDTLGHQEGDRVLASVAEVVRQELRDSDWAVRYGGDEFLLVLPETGGNLTVLAERVQGSVDRWSRQNIEPPLSVGIDLGWATWNPEEPRAVEQIVAAADEMLYEHKQDGTAHSGKRGTEARSEK